MRAPKYTVRDDAPTTLADVHRALAETGRIVVWSGASEGTVWGSAQENWRFRAWHDACHVQTGLGFSHADEVELAAYQRSQACSSWEASAVWIEVAEQALYHQATGLFVVDQLAFARAHKLEV